MSDQPRTNGGAQMVPHSPDPMPSLHGIIERAAYDKTFDLDKFKAMLDIYHEERADQRLQAFNQALTLAQSEMRAVLRDKPNQQTKSRYATLEAMDEPTRPIYTRYGFGLTFTTEPPIDPKNAVRVVCICSHNGGHTARYPLEAPLDERGFRDTVNKTPLHALGSTCTYLRRYLFMMVWNIVLTNDETDDDGNGASAGGISAGMGENIREKPAPKRTASMVLDEIEADAKNAANEEDLASLQREDRVRFIAEKGGADSKARLAKILQTESERIKAFWGAQGPVDDGSAVKEPTPPEGPPGLLKDVEVSEAERIMGLIQGANTARQITQIVGSMVNSGSINHLREKRPELYQRVEEARVKRLEAVGGES